MTEKPIVLMPEDVQRLLGKDAQRNNIMAAKLIAEILKTTLGPKGMDKMLVSETNDIVVTNDGATILDEMRIEHPTARMMVDIAKTQDSEVGDGTTTVVMIAGKLLENAEKLLDKKIHPTVITKGYRLAAEKCQEILKEITLRVTPQDEEVLQQIAMTAMTGKGAEDNKEEFAKIIVRAITQIKEENTVDLENIKIEKAKGEGVKNTQLIEGIIVDKEKVSHDMPTKVNNAKIALVDFPLELRNPEITTKISISTPEQLQNFLGEEERTIKEMINKVKSSGANVIFCQKGIDDFAQYLLSKNDIYACRRVSKSNMEKISKATSAKIVSSLTELTPFELGNAAIVEEVKHGDDTFTHIKGCQNPKALTILIHGGTDHLIDEIERALQDGMGVVINTLKDGFVVAGGGAVEMELSKKLKEFAQGLSGREQLAVEEFANALEFIPATLAENAGLDPIDIVTELKSRHDSSEKNAGLNLFTNRVENVLEARIIEPLKIKTQAISSASEVAIMILRIDDVIASSKGNSKISPQTMPPNYGGMGLE